MYLLIGNKDKLNSNFEVFNLSSNCLLKTINENNNVLFIIDPKINNGIINNTIILEEVFIMLNISLIICNKIDFKLQEICKYYKVKLIEILEI